MTVEVEIKAPCKDADAKVTALGAVFVKSETQEDTYFTHPCRDFRKTDEALRVRRTDRLVLAYKGPKRKSDLKVREEVEFEVPDDVSRSLSGLGSRRRSR